jgi:hypothetical protein
LLFAYRPDIWLFASGIVADRLGLALARGVGVPSPLPVVNGSVSDAWMAKNAVFSHSLRAVVMGPCVPWLRDYEQSTGVAVAVYAAMPGQPMRYLIRVFYPSDAKARAAADDAQSLIQTGTLRHRVACAGELVGARAAGNTLFLDGAAP